MKGIFYFIYSLRLPGRRFRCRRRFFENKKKKNYFFFYLILGKILYLNANSAILYAKREQ